MQITLALNEHEIQLGWEALGKLVDSLPDDDESLAGLFHELAQSNIAAVRAAVATKTVITEETLGLLASDPSPEVIGALVSVRRCRLSRSVLAQIIQRNWSDVNQRIAWNVESCDQSDIVAVAKLLAGSADPPVRAALANNLSTPDLILRQLSKDPDPEVRQLARYHMKR